MEASSEALITRSSRFDASAHPDVEATASVSGPKLVNRLPVRVRSDLIAFWGSPISGTSIVHEVVHLNVPGSFIGKVELGDFVVHSFTRPGVAGTSFCASRVLGARCTDDGTTQVLLQHYDFVACSAPISGTDVYTDRTLASGVMTRATAILEPWRVRHPADPAVSWEDATSIVRPMLVVEVPNYDQLIAVACAHEDLAAFDLAFEARAVTPMAQSVIDRLIELDPWNV